MGTTVTVGNKNVLPEGTYLAKIVSYDEVVTKTESKPKFVFHFQVEEGPLKGQVHDHWIPRIVDTATGMALVRPGTALAKLLADLGLGLPQFGQAFDLDVILNRLVNIVVKRNDKNPDYTNIVAFLTYTHPAPVQTAAASQQAVLSQPTIHPAQTTVVTPTTIPATNLPPKSPNLVTF